MARIAPDIPELREVPEALRSIVYMRSLNRAMKSPLTWLMGGIAIAAGAGIGVTAARALSGARSAGLGAGAAGALAAVWGFSRVMLPWRARQHVPAVAALPDNAALAQVVEASERLTRLAAAFDGQDARGPRKDPRDPSRLP